MTRDKDHWPREHSDLCCTHVNMMVTIFIIFVGSDQVIRIAWRQFGEKAPWLLIDFGDLFEDGILRQWNVHFRISFFVRILRQSGIRIVNRWLKFVRSKCEEDEGRQFEKDHFDPFVTERNGEFQDINNDACQIDVEDDLDETDEHRIGEVENEPSRKIVGRSSICPDYSTLCHPSVPIVPDVELT